MSVVEDVRQVLQDFIAPELRAFNARLDAMESRFDAKLDAIGARSEGRFNAIDSRLDLIEGRFSANLDAASGRSEGRFDAIDSRFSAVQQHFDGIDQRFDDLITIMNTRFDSLGKDVAQLKDMLEIDRRLTRLESKQSQVA
jgi:hypothetical protein